MASSAAPGKDPLPVAVSGGDGRDNNNHNGGGGSGGDDGSGESGDRFQGRNRVYDLMVGGLERRLEADPNFLFKISTECVTDMGIIFTLNYLNKGDRFWKELDFTFCHMACSLLNDIALVWLLAPVKGMPARKAVKTGIAAYLASLPSHMFEKAPAGRSFSLGQRGACFLYKTLIYGSIGLVMGMAGTSAVKTITDAREKIDPSYVPPPTEQPVLKSGLAWLGFMGLCSNTRYQTVNGLERLLYRPSIPLSASKSTSFAVRLANQCLGGQMWIWYANFLKLSQPRASHSNVRQEQPPCCSR